MTDHISPHPSPGRFPDSRPKCKKAPYIRKGNAVVTATTAFPSRSPNRASTFPGLILEQPERLGLGLASVLGG